MHEQNSAVDGSKRIDPLKTIVDKDLLRMASDMYRLKQNEAYWKSVPVPQRPTGTLRAEPALQVGVFAVPLLAYLLVALKFGFVHALFGLPLYYGVFNLLDKELLTRIVRKLDKEEDLDRGRYAFTRILGDRLGLKSEEVTLDVVLKMTCDFGILAIYGRNIPAEKKDDFMRRAYVIADLKKRLDFICVCLEETKHLAPVVKKEEKPTHTANGGRSSAAVTTAAALADANDEDDDRFSSYAPVNVMTGLPMIQGTPFDIGGNVYGQGTMGGFD